MSQIEMGTVMAKRPEPDGTAKEMVECGRQFHGKSYNNIMLSWPTCET